MERGIFRNAKLDLSATADNAAAEEVLPAANGQMYLLFGIHVEYSAAVAAKKAVTVAYTDEYNGAVTVTWELDINLSRAQDITFPHVIRTKPNTTVTVTLAASGAGGTTGRVGPYWTSV